MSEVISYSLGESGLPPPAPVVSSGNVKLSIEFFQWYSSAGRKDFFRIAGFDLNRFLRLVLVTKKIRSRENLSQ